MTKKALFLAGGWEGHEPQETSRFISNEIEKYDNFATRALINSIIIKTS